MCYGGCDCQRCNPSDEPVQKVSAWTTKRPTQAGWYWWREFDGMPAVPVLIRHTQDAPPELYAVHFGGKENWIEQLTGEWQAVQGPRE